MESLRVAGPVKKSKREKVQSCAIEREETRDTRPSSFGKSEKERGSGGKARLIIKMHSTEL